MNTIGIIADTHGLLKPQARAALAGVDLILHAGDIGDPAIITTLSEIAPVVSVRGNMDFGLWADDLLETQVVDLDGFVLYMLHDLDNLDLDPAAARFDAVVFGHTHRPHIEERKGIWYINPGSAGQSRFNVPLSVCLAQLDGQYFTPEIVLLEN